MRIAVKAKKYNKPQINADERRFIYRLHLRLIDYITLQKAKSIAAMFFETFLARPRKFPKPQYRTRMTRIARIFTDPCASASSVQSVFHLNTSAFICVHLRLILSIQEKIIIFFYKLKNKADIIINHKSEINDRHLLL